MRIKKSIFLVSVMLFVFGIANSQNLIVNKQAKVDGLVKQQQVFTSLENQSMETKTMFSEQANNGLAGYANSKEPEIIWQYTDPAGILNVTEVNGITGKTLGGWELNDKRISIYGDNSTAEWQSEVVSAWSYPTEMSSDGEYVAYGADNEIKVFPIDDSTPIWDYSFTGIAEGLCISPDGSKVYVAFEDFDGVAGTKLACYNVGNDTPVWSVDFPGNNEGIVMNKESDVLLLVQYGGGYNIMSIIDPENGDVIMEMPNQNQGLPSISDDGSIIVRGDYSGHFYAYEYDEDTELYLEKWDANLSAGTGTWVTGVSVSGDGTTVAAGTLVFTSTGYDGELYLFDIFSSTPIWSAVELGDQVTDIAMSYDGSIIAVSGYGPMSNNKPDFYLFRKNSNIPYFTHSTPGSMFAVSITPDGLQASFGGKSVHAREMGSGGFLFSVNCDQGGGTLSGTVDLVGEDDDSGVKIDVPELDNYFAFSDSEGNYEIINIPVGNYTVVASKVGYYPVTEDDVEIAEGQVTDLDFAMEATGNPPSNLMATKGASLVVDLTWDAPEAKEYFGFYIFRKNALEESFPQEPLAQVEADELSYSDETALPTRTYFYAVAADLGDDVLSPYSNIDEGWVCTGFIADEISVYVATTIPTIDGVISPGEWDDAFQIDCSDFLGTYDNTIVPVGSVMGYYKMNADATEMYVAYYNLNDTEIEDHDEVALYIDDNGDGVFPPDGDNSEGNYWAAHYASGDVIKYRPIYNTGGVGTVVYIENPQIASSIDEGYMVYEFVIPMGSDEDWQLNPGPDDKSTLGLFVLDDPSDFAGWWPYNNTNLFNPAGFQNMIYNAVDEVPPAPESLTIELIADFHVMLDWQMAQIDDFDYYNIYCSAAKDFEIIGNTIGNQYFYELPDEGSYQFYITTVDLSGQESEPSEIVDVNFYVGVSSLEKESIVSAVPNPFSNEIAFKFHYDKKADASMQIYNMSGAIVAEPLQGNINSGDNSIKWNGCDKSGNKLQTGVYFYRLMINEEIYMGKIILNR